MTTLGIAMIVRNGADTMKRALDPFVNIADEIHIVLGGRSDDETETMAIGYATWPVIDYDGPLDDEGCLWDFSAARQQVADLLTTDWMLQVDADDEWTGAEHLHDLIEDADKHGFDIVMFPYTYGNGELLSPRLFRRDSGKWINPIHEYWKLHDSRGRIMATDLIKIKQDRADDADVSLSRIRQDVTIAERWLDESNEPTPRLLALLGRDYVLAQQFEKGLETLNRYLLNYPGKREEELFQVHYTRGSAFLRLDRFADAIQAAALALSIRPFGRAWTLMAEAALLLAGPTPDGYAMRRLCVDCANQALAAGQSLATFWTNKDMVTRIPLQLKARALAAMGRKHEALATWDLLLALGEDKESQRMRDELCRVMKVLH